MDMIWCLPVWKRRRKNRQNNGIAYVKGALKKRTPFLPHCVLFRMGIGFFMSSPDGIGRMKIIDDAFQDHLLDEDVVAQQTNEAEGLQKLPVFFRKILKGLVGEIVFLA